MRAINVVINYFINAALMSHLPGFWLRGPINPSHNRINYAAINEVKKVIGFQPIRFRWIGWLRNVEV